MCRGIARSEPQAASPLGRACRREGARFFCKVLGCRKIGDSLFCELFTVCLAAPALLKPSGEARPGSPGFRAQRESLGWASGSPGFRVQRGSLRWTSGSPGFRVQRGSLRYAVWGGLPVGKQCKAHTSSEAAAVLKTVISCVRFATRVFAFALCFAQRRLWAAAGAVLGTLPYPRPAGLC